MTERIWILKSSLKRPLYPRGEGIVGPLIDLLLENRGVKGTSSAKAFLNPTLSALADPMKIKDMDRSVRTIVDAVEAGERIVVFGDYDADGLTASALVLRFFKEIGVDAGFYIPDRILEGYGLNGPAITRIASSGCRLLITVDCGSSNLAEIALAQALGMKVVITDHHRLRATQWPDCPLVNPNRDPAGSEHGDLSGVGVAFFLAVALRAALRERGWFRRRPYPDLKRYLDLVALGTIADRANVVGQNRILIKTGLTVLEEPRWEGIRALKKVSLLNGKAADLDAVAFRLAPRLNAAGRVGDAKMGLELLMADNESRAAELARALDTANTKRKDLEKKTLCEAEEMIGGRSSVGSRKAIVAASDGWHRGVLGLVASRLAERYRRPSLVFSLEDQMAVGSGRSIAGFNLFCALERLVGLLERFGGHSQAAGITIRRDNLERFSREIDDLAGEGLTPEMLVPRLEMDCELGLEEVSPRLVNAVEALRPFGEGNPAPLFLARSVDFLRGSVVGGAHLRMTLGCRGKLFDAIGFSLREYLPLVGRPVDIAYRPECNANLGGIRLRIADMREAV